MRTLDVLPSIFIFLSISSINNDDEYVQKMNKFDVDVRLLFWYRKCTFLNYSNVSFYFHCLQFTYLVLQGYVRTISCRSRSVHDARIGTSQQGKPQPCRYCIAVIIAMIQPHPLLLYKLR